jgi:hypothetical protein
VDSTRVSADRALSLLEHVRLEVGRLLERCSRTPQHLNLRAALMNIRDAEAELRGFRRLEDEEARRG